jgi:predicted O-methyltransferase YrrM
MEPELWRSVDTWFANQLIGPDDALDHARAESNRAGLRPISVSANQGKLLHLVARLCGARRILEIGTLGGYSGIWLARALPSDGRLITLELDPNSAEVARRNFAYAGLGDVTEVRVGRAVDSLQAIAGEGQPPFDLAFIDADKESNPDYFSWALEHVRTGGLIIIDNVVRRGRVIDASDTEADILGVRRVTEMISKESRVSATAIQTVGDKGYDGFLLALVVG